MGVYIYTYVCIYVCIYIHMFTYLGLTCVCVCVCVCVLYVYVGDYCPGLWGRLVLRGMRCGDGHTLFCGLGPARLGFVKV